MTAPQSDSPAFAEARGAHPMNLAATLTTPRERELRWPVGCATAT